MTNVPRLRNEDPRLLTGDGRFVDDVDRPGQLWMRVVRSPVAAGRIVRTDAAAALRLDRVHGVVTADELRPVPRIPVRLGPFDCPLDPFRQPVLADGQVRYVGEPIAVVVADDPYLAEDAADLVVVEIEASEPILDAREAMADEAPRLREGLSNEVIALERGFGDVERAFERADRIIEIDVRIGRQSAVPLECRGLVADYDPARDALTLWGGTKVPHFNRGVLATLLGISERQISYRSSDVGGGFGVRGELYPEDFLVAYLARRFGRPVKWIEDRTEHLIAANHSREQARKLTGAFSSDGRVLALRDVIFHDNGAYLRTHGMVVPELTMSMLAGPYRIPAYRGTAHVVLTNKTPSGTYRAPGRYEATFARERLFDLAARELALDPVELRRRNLLTVEDLPHERAVPVLEHNFRIEAGDFGGLLEQAQAAAGWDDWVREAEALRATGRRVGVGLACFLEKSGGGEYETVGVSVGAAGRIRVAGGGTSLGQGIETVLAIVVGEELGVAPEEIEVVLGDTDLVSSGAGTWASRSTIFAGGAAALAAKATAKMAREVASELLEVAPKDLVLEHGRITVAGTGVSIEWAEVAAACDPVSNARRGWEPGLGAERTFADAPMTFPYGVHMAQVELDPVTGQVRVLRLHVGYEVGRAIDRRLVESQLIGGAAQGIGGALLEELPFDAGGQPKSSTLLDYLLPTSFDVPRITTTVTEEVASSGNPLGVMGAGEGGITGCPAAIAAAVDDALGRPGAIREIPIRLERVRTLCASGDDRPSVSAGPAIGSGAVRA